VHNTDLLVYLVNNRIAAETEKEGIPLCGHWLCGTGYSHDGSNIQVRILVLISETMSYGKLTSIT
jgi:hypothetical protein